MTLSYIPSPTNDSQSTTAAHRKRKNKRGHSSQRRKQGMASETCLVSTKRENKPTLKKTALAIYPRQRDQQVILSSASSMSCYTPALDPSQTNLLAKKKKSQARRTRNSGLQSDKCVCKSAVGPALHKVAYMNVSSWPVSP